MVAHGSKEGDNVFLIRFQSQEYSEWHDMITLLTLNENQEGNELEKRKVIFFSEEKFSDPK